jgi:thiol-disulfide isomerase/thioredoxin
MGCRKPSATQDEQAQIPAVPCPTGPAEQTPSEDTDYSALDIPRFAANSPFDVNGQGLLPVQEEKHLWAKSFLWEKPPDLVVEQWLSDVPETQGKCVLIEFWATWCPPCRKSITLLNQLHARFQDRLVVIGISEESEQTVRNFHKPRIEYYSAIDTQQRTKNELAVLGIPHIILMEPEGYVVWEGFPYQKGYELTEDVVASILDIAFQTEP